MTIVANEVLRLGVLVERTDSKWIPFEYRMFHCRQRDPGDTVRRPIAEWAQEEVHLMPEHGFNQLFKRMKVGEYDSDMTPLKIKRA